MRTCSTATSTHRGNETRRRRRQLPSSEAVSGHLETRLQDLERDWDAYKTGRSSSGPRRHRRSRSASGLPSSAVTVAAPDDGFHLSLRRCSPRRLVSSLQQTGTCSADAPTGPRDQEDASSVCSVSVATYSSASCSCPSQCAVLCCGYSTSSSCTGGTTVAPFSSAVRGVNGERRARKVDEGMWWPSSRVVWISAAAIVLVVVGFVAMMIIFELALDEGSVEYQVPT